MPAFRGQMRPSGRTPGGPGGAARRFALHRLLGAICGAAVGACAGELPGPAAEARPDAGLPDAVVVPGADTGRPCVDADGDGYRSCDGDCDDTSVFIQPAARELCDGLDNNCDGRVDEGFRGLGDACHAGVGACTAQGTVVCALDALGVRCGVEGGVARDETCDGTDEDCDGSIDEGAPACCEPGETRPCGLTEGECRQGTSTCDANQVYGACEGGRGPAEHEACNGLDDDCDELTDEEIPGTGADCRTDQPGVCTPGRMECLAEGLECVALATPTGERCNGVDDDCDGEVDERLRNPNGDCCEATPETCNGVDDDCDGRIDEDTADAARICVTSRGRFEARVVDGRAGHALIIVPDQNGDGFVDVLAGAPGPPSPSEVAGSLYLVSGADGLLLRQMAGDPADGELGYSLAAADFDGDGVDEWIVGAPDGQSASNHHGRVYVLEPATFRTRGTLNGNASGSRFGDTVAAAAPIRGEVPVLVIGQPSLNAAAGRVAVYDLTADPVTGDFQRALRWAVEGAFGQENLGATVAVGAPDDFGDRSIWYTHADDGSPRDVEIQSADALTGMPIAAISSPLTSAQTFGRSLATSAELPVLATGAWGAESGGSTRGAAWLMWPDGEVIDTVGGLDADAHLGFSAALGSGLREASDLTWCAGAITSSIDPAAALPRAGYAVCRTENGQPVATVAGAEPGDGFGWSMALSSTPDPDGGYLLAVGAPRSSTITRNGGMVHLFRLVPE